MNSATLVGTEWTGEEIDTLMRMRGLGIMKMVRAIPTRTKYEIYSAIDKYGIGIKPRVSGATSQQGPILLPPKTRSTKKKGPPAVYRIVETSTDGSEDWFWQGTLEKLATFMCDRINAKGGSAIVVRIEGAALS